MLSVNESPGVSLVIFSGVQTVGVGVVGVADWLVVCIMASLQS